MFIDEHRERFGVELICETIEVSASAYYERRSGREVGPPKHQGGPAGWVANGETITLQFAGEIDHPHLHALTAAGP